MRRLDTSKYRDRLDVLAHELAEVLEFDDAERVIIGIKQVLADSRAEAPRNHTHIEMRDEARELLHEAEIVAGEFLLLMKMTMSRAMVGGGHRPMGLPRMTDLIHSRSRNPPYRWIRVAEQQDEPSLPSLRRAMRRAMRCRR